MIDGIGVDIIEIPRIARAVLRRRFVTRVFTPAEAAYCECGSRSAERFAGRFAAKEAIAKALGRSLNWQEVEILPLRSGKPEARLSGAAAGRLAGRRLLVSISHCHTYAVAQAVVHSADLRGEPEE